MVVRLSIFLKHLYIYHIKSHSTINSKKVLSYYDFIRKIYLFWIEQDLWYISLSHFLYIYIYIPLYFYLYLYCSPFYPYSRRIRKVK